MSEENCDMKFLDIREHIKYLKYGYGRVTDQLNIAIRQSLIDRKKAISIVKKTDGKVSKKNIAEFCQYLNISEEKYNNIVDSFTNKEIFYKNNKNEWVLKEERI